MVEHIKNLKILNRHLDELILLEPCLKDILEISGDVPLRLKEGGFEGMSAIISAQLLSVASANAIHKRLVSLLGGEVSAKNYVNFSEQEVRQCGFSRSKFSTMPNIALAELNGELNYQELEELPLQEAMKCLTSHKGIGTWSAQIYMLFCVGHGDIFPSGDLVLQKMLAKILQLEEKPNEKQAIELTKNWSPYRGAGARLLWRYFAVLKNREGI